MKTLNTSFLVMTVNKSMGSNSIYFKFENKVNQTYKIIEPIKLLKKLLREERCINYD
jgi:hypothetical protein